MNTRTRSEPRLHPPPHAQSFFQKATHMYSFFMHGALRVAVFVASFAAASASMVAVGALFHSAGAPGALRDSPGARAAVARCDVAVRRDQRRDCVRRVVAEARSRDAGGAMVAASRSPSMPQ
jgi:hypothetical protein